MSSAANDTSDASSLPDAATATTGVAAIVGLRNFSRGIGYFWQGITYVFLLILLATTFAQRPALWGQPRGWAILVLTVAFGAWYYVGYTWLLHANLNTHWESLAAGRLPPAAWRGFLLWAVAILLALGLYALDSNFRWMLWSVYGVAFTAWPLPFALALFAPTAFAIFATQGWLPTDWQPLTLIWFATGVGMFCIYTAIAYLPFRLLQGRFERERMFADLEASHQGLATAHRQLEAARARDRELAALRERGRIARDMHDTLGHSLALIAVKLEAAQRLRRVDAARADREIAATQTIARSALAELRATLTELRAALPEQPPLGETLARAARAAGERAGWRVSYDIAPDLPALDDEATAALLRVGAEALANAERHAHAHHISLTLAHDGCDILLRVQDDGVGMGAADPLAPQPTPTRDPVAALATGDARTPPGSAAEAGEADHTPPPTAIADAASIASPPGHYGITGMRERIAEVGGRFNIGPACAATDAGAAPARGTLVEARIPASGIMTTAST